MSRSAIYLKNEETSRVDIYSPDGQCVLFTARFTKLDGNQYNVDLTIPRDQKIDLFQCWNEGKPELSQTQIRNMIESLPSGATLTIATKGETEE